VEFTGVYWSWLELTGVDWSLLEFTGVDWSWLEFIGIYWSWLELTGVDWSLLELTGVDWSLLELTGVDWSWLELTGVDWSWLEFTGVYWSWLELTEVCVQTVTVASDHAQWLIDTQYDPFRRVIGRTQRTLPSNTQNPPQTHIHTLGGIRTHNPRKWAATNSRSHRYRHRKKLAVDKVSK